MTTFGGKVRARREELGLTLDDLARLLGDAGVPISRQALSKWELGAVLPNIGRVAILATVLGVNPGDLIDDEAS